MQENNMPGSRLGGSGRLEPMQIQEPPTRSLFGVLDPTGKGRINVNDNLALQGLSDGRSTNFESSQEQLGRFKGWCGAYFCICCCPNPYQTVPQGYTGVILRFEKFYKLLGPGIYYINPQIDKLKCVDKRERTVDLHQQVVVTKDNMSLRVDAVLFYKIYDTHKALFRVDGVNLLVRDLAMTTMRGVVARLSLQEFIEKKEGVSEKIAAIMN
jgi:erythrocyte band 7 integral membrane protein